MNLRTSILIYLLEKNVNVIITQYKSNYFIIFYGVWCHKFLFFIDKQVSIAQNYFCKIKIIFFFSEGSMSL